MAQGSPATGASQYAHGELTENKGDQTLIWKDLSSHGLRGPQGRDFGEAREELTEAVRAARQSAGRAALTAGQLPPAWSIKGASVVPVPLHSVSRLVSQAGGGLGPELRAAIADVAARSLRPPAPAVQAGLAVVPVGRGGEEGAVGRRASAAAMTDSPVCALHRRPRRSGSDSDWSERRSFGQRSGAGAGDAVVGQLR